MCQEVGKNVHAYTYELQGYRSEEREKTEALARHFGWPLTVVTVPTGNIANDFKRLAIGLRCRKKVQFEVLFPLIYVLREIKETEIWAAINADDHFGNTREVMFEHARLRSRGISPAERKALFDEYRRQTYEESDRPQSSHTWRFAREVASSCGKTVARPVP